MRYFETLFLEEAEKFIASLDTKTVKKILYRIDLAEQSNDPKVFKKLNDNIWEFRLLFHGQQIRLLAFWDNRQGRQHLVIATNGFIKKTSKLPAKELKRAESLRKKYLEQ